MADARKESEHPIWKWLQRLSAIVALLVLVQGAIVAIAQWLAPQLGIVSPAQGRAFFFQLCFTAVLSAASVFAVMFLERRRRTAELQQIQSGITDAQSLVSDNVARQVGTVPRIEESITIAQRQLSDDVTRQLEEVRRIGESITTARMQMAANVAAAEVSLGSTFEAITHRVDVLEEATAVNEHPDKSLDTFRKTFNRDHTLLAVVNARVEFAFWLRITPPGAGAYSVVLSAVRLTTAILLSYSRDDVIRDALSNTLRLMDAERAEMPFRDYYPGGDMGPALAQLDEAATKHPPSGEVQGLIAEVRSKISPRGG